MLTWIRRSFRLHARRPSTLSDIDQARQLIAAIDRGGIPLNTAKVNAIARDLELEVSTRARLDETVQRIRQALSRAPQPRDDEN